MCTHAGVFPCAEGHYCEREAGCGDLVVIVCAAGLGWSRWDSPAATKRSVARGECLLLPPGMYHAYGADDKSPWTIHWMHMAGPALAGLLPALGAPGILCGVDLDRIAKACDRAWSELATGSEMEFALRAAGPAWDVVLTLIAHRLAPPLREKADVRVLRAEAIMRERTSERLSLPEIARMVGCSVPHLAALFHLHRGESPMRRYNRIRMNDAARLLSSTGMKVATVAARLGYDDPFYFSRCFSKVHGVPPSLWRKRRPATRRVRTVSGL
jgi:AraC family transcriptional regulator of arabinose operon